jgi:succinyl-CoA synthetase alpha subunit
MSILLHRDTAVCVQGITGQMGQFQTREMLAFGTRVVAGVSPGKGGSTFEGIPIFNTVAQAVAATGIELSCLWMGAARAKEAIFEAVDAGVRTVVCVAEFMPVHDMLIVKRRLHESSTRLIGPNCSGLISPGQAKAGFYCGEVCAEGYIGVMSKSGTLSYAVLLELKRAGMGESTIVGVGGDEIKGTSFRDCLALFEADPETKATVMIGEVGGHDEEEAAEYVAQAITKPVVAFVAGRTIPPGQSVGHAGAIVKGRKGTHEGKVRALTAAGVRVATTIEEIPSLLRDAGV